QPAALVERLTKGTVHKTLLRYQLANHLGSASLEIDSQGQAISYEEYFPYGSTSYQATNYPADTEVKRYRYSSAERDEETGIEYHLVRYYLPWLARWVAPAPLGAVDGLNLYAYARGRPMTAPDRIGTQCDPTKASCPEPVGSVESDTANM